MKRKFHFQCIILLCCALGVLVLSGCGSAGDSNGSDSDAAQRSLDVAADGTGSFNFDGSQLGRVVRYDGPVPDFKGPYAEEFRDEYRATSMDLQRRILDDERITEQEIVELKSHVENCLAGRERYVKWHFKGAHEYGRSVKVSPMSEEESTRAVKQIEEETESNICDLKSTASIIGFADEIRSNPENLDVPTIMAACMVRSGLRPRGYTAEDYKQDFTRSFDGEFDDSPGSSENGPTGRFRQCNLDPLGLLGDNIGR